MRVDVIVGIEVFDHAQALEDMERIQAPLLLGGDVVTSAHTRGFAQISDFVRYRQRSHFARVPN